MKKFLWLATAAAICIPPHVALAADPSPTFDATSLLWGETKLDSRHQACIWVQPKAGSYTPNDNDVSPTTGATRVCIPATASVSLDGKSLNAGGGGGGGGSTSVTVAASAPGPLTDLATGQSLYINTRGAMRFVPTAPAASGGGEIDLTAPSALIGRDGTSVMSSGNPFSVSVVDPIPAGTNNIGDVDIVTMPAITLTGMGAQGTGSTFDPPTGGSGLLGYLSGIFKAVTGTLAVGGNVANNAVDSGNPVKVGCIYSASAALSGLTVANRADCQADNVGNLRVRSGYLAVTGADGVANASLTMSPNTGSNNSAQGGPLQAAGYGFNGTTWDRLRGDTLGLATSPYGLSASRWSYASPAAGDLSNTTTAKTVKAAVASNKNCFSGFQLKHDTLGAGGEFVIRDGAGGTVLYRTILLTVAETINYAPQAAICGTANTLLEIATLTVSITGVVYVDISGNIEP